MKIIKGLVKGPFKDEAAFKMAVIKAWQERAAWFTRIEIENEEKAPGMPDVLSISNKHPAYLTEFKISDDKGVIKFQKTQPLFYKRHKNLSIGILAWDRQHKRVVYIEPSEVLAVKGLNFKIPDAISDVKIVPY